MSDGFKSTGHMEIERTEELSTADLDTKVLL
jgi:hypothetical protein